jgi:hypothetical protein
MSVVVSAADIVVSHRFAYLPFKVQVRLLEEI